MVTKDSLTSCLDDVEDHQLVDLVCELFSHCSHRQQLELLKDRLPRFLKRDFLSLLPPEVVGHVLRFLGVRDVFRCLLVSRAWHKIITDCHSFWKNYNLTLGLFPSFLSVLLDRYITYKAVAVALLKARKSISRAKPIFQHYPDKTRRPPKATISCRPAPPMWNGLFISHDVYASSDVGTYVLSIRALDQSNNLVELTSMTVSHAFVVIWSQSSPRHVLIHGSDGSWIQTRIISREACELTSATWMDTVYSLAYYEMACCPDCCLVGISSRAAREEKWWDLLVYRLVEGREEPHKLKTCFEFLPFESRYNSVFFQIHKLVMTSCSSDCGGDGFCSQHRLLIQFGATICIFSLCIESYEAGSEAAVVQNLCALCPFNDHSYYCTPSVLGHEFCLSRDGKFAAYPVNGDIFAWDLDMLELCQYSRRGAQFPANSDIIAVGSLFSVVYTSSTQVLRVISTVSGETLLVHFITVKGDNPVYGPTDQLWLNDATSVGEEGLPLAIMLREWQKPGVWLLTSSNSHLHKS